ncbi:uncharacterized protein LOC121754707 [Salvia splendens]|uniref:uncharacterized protein LOC121754707 n=1 Tax=Salvia splendens TaxID=180675 RepID=UPI001C272469|nr:uncharacterized protein LOC121754707 [Salvia splendens]
MDRYFKKLSSVDSSSVEPSLLQPQELSNEDKSKVDLENLPSDPGERPDIMSYPPNLIEQVRRAYLLKVATASVERAFSAMKIIKTSLRNSMGDQLLNDCLVPYIENDVFVKVTNETIMQRLILDPHYEISSSATELSWNLSKRNMTQLS